MLPHFEREAGPCRDILRRHCTTGEYFAAASLIIRARRIGTVG